MKKEITKTMLLALALVPLTSISMAAEYRLMLNEKKISKKEIETQFMEKLDAYELPLRYYHFLDLHDIRNTKQLNSKEFKDFKNRLLGQFEDDFINPYALDGGAISVF